LEVYDQQRNGAVALSLDDEPAIELQGRAKQQGQRDHLRQQARDRLWVVVAIQQIVDGAAKTDHAAADVQVLDGKGHDVVIVAGVKTGRGARGRGRGSSRKPGGIGPAG
jgi:hypothetical protein